MEDVTNAQELREIYERRRFELLKQQAYQGINTPAEINLQIQELNKKIGDIDKNIYFLKNKNNIRESIIEKFFQRKSHVSILLDEWSIRFDILKSSGASDKQKSDIERHIGFLRERRDDISSLLDSDDYCNDLFSYSRRILFEYCRMRKSAIITDYVSSMVYDEVKEMLRDARFCLKQAEEKGLHKGLLYFHLAAIYYELDDDAPEKIYEYCKKALEKQYDYPELHSMLYNVCRVLIGYKGEYYNEASEYISLNKVRRRNSNVPPFCPSGYLRR